MTKRTSTAKSKARRSPKRATRTAAATVAESAEHVADRARQVGRRVSDLVQDAPEYLQARRSERALRAEMDDHCRAIGKRVIALCKRSQGDHRPFARFSAIEREVDAHARVEEEYRATRERLSQLRAEMRGRG